MPSFRHEAGAAGWGLGPLAAPSRLTTWTERDAHFVPAHARAIAAVALPVIVGERVDAGANVVHPFRVGIVGRVHVVVARIRIVWVAGHAAIERGAQTSLLLIRPIARVDLRRCRLRAARAARDGAVERVTIGRALVLSGSTVGPRRHATI